MASGSQAFAARFVPLVHKRVVHPLRTAHHSAWPVRRHWQERGATRRLAAQRDFATSSKRPKKQVVVYEEDVDWRRWTPEMLLLRLYSRAREWRADLLGNTKFPPSVTICTSGADFGAQLPRPELVLNDGLEKGSQDWRRQLFGAAIYWHLATTPGADHGDPDFRMLQGKDVLEVACQRGGGARYLAEVAQPRLYIAAGADPDAMTSGPNPTALRWDPSQPGNLATAFDAESFDFVLCVEPGKRLQDLQRFARGVAHVLRPGGHLLFCETLDSSRLEELRKAIEAAGLSEKVCENTSQEVFVAGLSQLPYGSLYLRIVVKKEG